MISLFTKHPNENGETYWQHAKFAILLSLKLVLLAFAALTHAIFPFIFVETVSKNLPQLLKRSN